jgi:hypothetical protein
MTLKQLGGERNKATRRGLDVAPRARIGGSVAR